MVTHDQEVVRSDRAGRGRHRTRVPVQIGEPQRFNIYPTACQQRENETSGIAQRNKEQSQEDGWC